MLSHMLSFFLVIGCTGSEPVSEEIAVEQFLKMRQVPNCLFSTRRRQTRPKNIQLGACKDGATMHITLHRECPSGKYIHNNAWVGGATTISFTKVKRL